MLVIGSGPGGAMTACMAAEAGRDVLLVEEGAQHAVDSAPPFSLAEMEQKYRNAGLNVTFGGTSITYLEGRCVGGGSEINAALYAHQRSNLRHRGEHGVGNAGRCQDHAVDAVVDEGAQCLALTLALAPAVREKRAIAR